MERDAGLNALLGASVGSELVGLLESAGTWTSVPRGRLIAPRGELASAYFITNGVASARYGERGIEVALIGREGMVGSELALGNPTTFLDTAAATDVVALKVPAEKVARGLSTSPRWRLAMLRYAQALSEDFVQAAEASTTSLKGRLSRRILQISQKTGSSRVVMTHAEFALALSVRRPGVTTALHELEGDRLIKADRGRIEVLNEGGLVVAAQVVLRRRW